MKKSTLLWSFLLFAMFSLLLCQARAAEEIPSDTPPPPMAEASLTPFNYLNLITANSEYLSFSYKVIKNGQEEDLGSISRTGENIVAVFHAIKMDGSKIKIRQIETSEQVFYVIDSEKRVFEFKAPAGDILLNRMQNIVKTGPEKVFRKDDAIVYEHQETFEHDESIKLSWLFHMKDNRLVRLEYLFDGKIDTVYEFSEFSQDEPAAELFVIPEGYTKESFSYPYLGDTMPPWFE